MQRGGGDVAQLGKRRTGTPLAPVRFSSAAARDFLQESVLSVDFLTGSAALAAAVALPENRISRKE